MNPDPSRFLADLEGKPLALARLAASADVRGAIADIPRDPHRIVLLGMGSSRFAAEVAALRLRVAGLDAVSEYASTEQTAPPGPGVLAIAISASGRSKETLAALERYAGRARTLAITNDLASPIATMADLSVPLEAGPETGGVACRTFQHTGLVLRAIEDHFLERRSSLAELCARVGDASIELLERRAEWLPPLDEALDGPSGVHVLAPVERWPSAAQSALMIREGPRRPATASETGDWSHVDVYLTRTTDYRALLYAGSRYDTDALEWMRQRGSTVVSVGAELPGVELTIRYAGDESVDVAVHAETLVAELLAARWWLAQSRAAST